MSVNPKRVVHERRLRDIAIKKRDRNLSAFKKQIRVLRRETKTPSRNEQFDPFRLRKYLRPWGDTCSIFKGHIIKAAIFKENYHEEISSFS